MWISREIVPFLRQECEVGEKILETKTKHNIEIFSHPIMGKVALVDKKQLFAQKYLCVDSELLAHVPLCSHPSPAQVLLFETLNIQIAHECLKHGVSVDCVQERASLEALGEVFPQYSEVMGSERFSLYAQAMDLEIKKYQVIIADSHLNAHQIDGLSRMLSDDGILIIRAPQPFLDMEGYKAALQSCGAFFSIIMPFMPHVSAFNDTSYIFASKRYHPTADMILQKIDLLPNLCYYNAKIHESAFVLPNCVFNQISDMARF